MTDGDGSAGATDAPEGSPADDGPHRRLVVASAWVAGRREPDRRAEMTTQWLCGEVLRAADGDRADDAWLRVRGPDGYASWVHAGGLWEGPGPGVTAWQESATARSLGVTLTAAAPGSSEASGASGGRATSPSGDGPPPDGPRYLPWGAPVVAEGEGRVRLPGGTASCEPADGVVDGRARAERFPPRGEAVADTALRWRGVPYLWGGRTREGADCSGFVQAVYLLHGVPLPRDSGDQLAAGPPVAGDGAAAGPEGRRPGDLLFFGAGPDDVTHVALAVGGERLVHAAAANGRVAVDELDGDSLLERRLRRRLVGATRPLASG